MEKILFNQMFRCIIFGLIILFGSPIKAQCSLAPVPFNGTSTINGIQITGTASGDVNVPSYGIYLGENRGSWSFTLTFNHPVNDLEFYYTPNILPTFSTNAHFNTNGGAVSITETYGNNSNWIINDNKITKPYGINGGRGDFKITSPNDFTTITVNGDAFPSNLQGHYAAMVLCSSNVLAVNDINSEVKNNIISIYPNPVKNIMTISSKENLKSYKILDESGRHILSSSLKGNKQNVDLSSIKSGHYVVSVETEKQTINTKLIKE
ncbi:T9SS C-terminal target domain-containing protein [Chryseobacterium nematophagum]|uniref:T9SS C-terminal target domain-containing protein n=1 Tax=Chryseobacterium nematophagum TaxID=2305228 RepID=A0A3M7TC89_9FLAO|nr:T9SS type A sorting domain-containing protein [Chryseobacterium nematophagum]RNA61061.1 T9SS C-terminal target domain-containing protein [Chryseobacterium nematophagum]